MPKQVNAKGHPGTWHHQLQRWCYHTTRNPTNTHNHTHTKRARERHFGATCHATAYLDPIWRLCRDASRPAAAPNKQAGGSQTSNKRRCAREQCRRCGPRAQSEKCLACPEPNGLSTCCSRRNATVRSGRVGADGWIVRYKQCRAVTSWPRFCTAVASLVRDGHAGPKRAAARPRGGSGFS